MPNYDYIIIGAGASGLLLADAMGKDNFFASKSILLLDKDAKKTNDRTWCFWEKGNGDFDAIIHKKWPQIFFAGQELKLSSDIAPYTYKMLKGIDFYSHYLDKIKRNPNITFLQEKVISVLEKKSQVIVSTQENQFLGGHVFNSIFDYQKPLNQKKYPVLQQHFLGWFIKTDRSVFTENEATFMDFSIPQKGNTRFMYVLPFSETEALVEYTLFSEHVLEKKEYETAIESYLKEKLKVSSYSITAVEKGNIPMTCFNFSNANSDRILHIGIAGGWAKSSTGYTFYNSSKKVRELVLHLKSNKSLSKFSERTRFWYYDLLLLDILQSDNHLGGSIFEAMFKKRKPQLILKFLDEETTFWEELQIIWSCPKWPFIKALFKRMF
ncbi:lycopene cyclase family protein [uncultured Croceitalea sp.]|uniref:lycopene cyclase family protein n=1 Tax=uncultured Croceitalea sp. TaxID=1798908 RepID=UPI003305F064